MPAENEPTERKVTFEDLEDAIFVLRSASFYFKLAGLLTAFIVFTGVTCFISLLVFEPSLGDPFRLNRVVEAERLVIEDGDLRERAQLGMANDGSMLILYGNQKSWIKFGYYMQVSNDIEVACLADTNGKPRIQFGLDERLSSLMVQRVEGKPMASAMWTEETGSGLSFTFGTPVPAVGMLVTEKGRGLIGLVDEKGEPVSGSRSTSNPGDR